jgi:predicted NUDIX family NTP pyrophosphohydrolase
VARRHDSAGLVIFRRTPALAFLLVHPGGPYWTRKDDGAWSIPKGEIEDGEDKLVAARREAEEETGFAPKGKFLRLAPVRQPSGKVIHSWGIEAPGLDAAKIRSGVFEMEWPPRSGRTAEFPEVDRAAWFEWAEAQIKILPGQRPILERLKAKLEPGNPEPAATF